MSNYWLRLFTVTYIGKYFVDSILNFLCILECTIEVTRKVSLKHKQ